MIKKELLKIISNNIKSDFNENIKFLHNKNINLSKIWNSTQCKKK
jgi:hypothetical protein